MTLKAVVTLESLTAEEKDNVTNTFAIGGTVSEADVDPTMEAALNAAFADFYNAVPTGATAGNALGVFLSTTLSRVANANRLDLYDTTGLLDGAPHGSPFSSTLWTLTPASATAYPSEVACCVTLESSGRADAPVETPDGTDSDSLVDRPQQRHTGRVYIGPLATVAGSVVSSVSRPSAGFLDCVRLAVKDLNADIIAATAGAGWLGVWSRKDASIRPVAFVSTDDAWDTQRRRGEGPTGRTRIAV